ncbi:MAG: FAS1-like dehydratase domain-containing protein, partial [Planctomycetota bacterium]
MPSYGLDLNTAVPGQILESPHEVTIDESWRMQWQSVFPTSNHLYTSSEYATRCGFDSIPIPQAMLLNMTLCFSVEPFSQSCRLHLGLENARQELPVYCGDTLRSFTRIDGMANTSRGDASVIHSTHILINQRDERVFSLKKRSYYDPLPVSSKSTADPVSDDRSRFFDGAVTSLIDHYSGVTTFPSTQTN